MYPLCTLANIKSRHEALYRECADENDRQQNSQEDTCVHNLWFAGVTLP